MMASIAESYLQGGHGWAALALAVRAYLLTGNRPASPSALIPAGLSMSLAPMGTRTAPADGTVLPLDQTGVTIKIHDLSIASADSKAVIAGKTYRLPGYTAGGLAEIESDDSNIELEVRQDGDGNTIVAAAGNGQHAEINLGRIAALKIATGAGDDKISVAVKNYYGGIDISDSGGENEIKVSGTNILNDGITITGGSGDDTISISGLAIKVLIDGLAGNDAIDARGLLENGRPPSVELGGGADGDLIYGGDFGGSIYGGGGADFLSGGKGSDRIFGDDGADVVRGRGGADRIWGGAGDDVLYGGNQTDLIAGEAGNDILVGYSGNDRLDGGAGDDWLYTANGGAWAHLGGDSDILRGGAGVNAFAPYTKLPQEIYPIGRTADYFKVMTRLGLRRQAILSAYPDAHKALTDYDYTKDYLVDLRWV